MLCFMCIFICNQRISCHFNKRFVHLHYMSMRRFSGEKNPISINNAKLANSRKHYNELRRMLPRSWVSFTVPLEQEQLSVNSEECPLQRRFCPFLQYFYLFFFVRARWPLPTLPSSTSDSF